MKREDIELFVIESNAIEGITRPPTLQEIHELERFIALDKVTVEELESFVKVYQPNARLRDDFGFDVQINNPCFTHPYYPPFGGPDIREHLINLLLKDYDAYTLHVEYEKLHPFTDGNGRSGRALWAWKTQSITNGFLMNFYFQALHNYKSLLFP